jgi:tetratricopeptide (TPR) repeat protein
MLLKSKNICNPYSFSIAIWLCLSLYCQNANAKMKVNSDSLIAVLNSNIATSEYQEVAEFLYQSDSSNKQYALYNAKAYKLLGNDIQSAFYLNKSLGKDSLFLQALYFKTLLLIDSKNLWEAEKLTEKIGEYYPDEIEHYQAKAKYFFAIKDWAEAKRYSAKAINKNNKVCDAQILHALVLMQLDEYKAAAGNFSNCIGSIRQNSDYLNNYGVCLLKSQRYEDAELIFKSAIQHDSSKYLYFFNLGLAQMKSEHYTDASISFDRTAQLCDTVSELNLLQAISFEKQYRIEEALKSYRNYKASGGAINVSKNIAMLQAVSFISTNWYYLVAALIFSIGIIVLLIRRKS